MSLPDRQICTEFPSYAWPGGYPLFYVTIESCDVLCATCAAAEYAAGDAEPVISDANYEDPSLYCDNCSQRIESAYAEDEVDQPCDGEE